MAEEVIQDGSEDHPWLANNYADMVDYLTSKTDSDGNQPCWVRLTTDINCNEVCPEGWTTVNMYNNFDMYDHKIIAPLIKDKNYLFYDKTNKNLNLMNGHILNVYENFTSTHSIFGRYSNGSNICFLNMQIDFHFRNKNVDFGNATSIKNCRISINGIFNPSGAFFDSDTTIDSNIFELNYTSSNVSKMLFSSGYTKKQINNCLFTGTVDNFNLCSNCIQGETATASAGSFVNCVIAVKTSNTVTYRYAPYGNNLISSETKGMHFATSYGTIETLTDDQLKSLTAVQATQFYVATPPANTSSGGT